MTQYHSTFIQYIYLNSAQLMGLPFSEKNLCV